MRKTVKEEEVDKLGISDLLQKLSVCFRRPDPGLAAQIWNRSRAMMGVLRIRHT